MAYACILFDLDQTLLRKIPTTVEKLREILSADGTDFPVSAIEKAFADSEFWIGVQTQRENQTGIRMNDDEFLARILEIYRNALDLSEAQLSSIIPAITGRYGKLYTLMPGAQELLSRLSQMNLRLGIVSNNYSQIRETLNQLNLTQYFHCIIISEEVGL